VANRAVAPHRSALITSVRVGKDLDAADAHIAESAVPGDIVVTADIPLAAKVVAKGAVAIDPRGDIFSEENIGERLALRDLLQGLRAGGMVTGGPAPFSNSDRQSFANAFDRLLTATLRGAKT
jgi:uncharacterized protein YaiI (UPF0178 family)